MNDLLTNLPIGQLTDLLNSIIDQMADFLTDNSKRVGVVDPGGAANLYSLWDWVGMAPQMGPESCSCTFPLGRPVSRKASGK